MKLVLNQKELSRYISFLGHIVDPKPSLPVLGNILINAQDKNISLVATNLEVTIKVMMNIKPIQTGISTVPARTFTDLVTSLPDEEINLEKNGNILTLTTNTSSSQFNTMDPENFPEIPETPKKEDLQISAGELKTALEHVVFAASVDSTTPIFCGVLFDKDEDGKLSLVASDGYRLSKFNLKIEKLPETLPWIIPVKSLKEIIKVLATMSDGQIVKFYQIGQKKQIMIEVDNIVILSRVIDGEYPNYKNVIPTSNQTQAIFSYANFKDALKQVNIFAREMPGNRVTMTFSASNKNLSLEATLSEVGSNKTSIPMEIKGNDLKIVFSSKLLSDFFNSIYTDDITFECEGNEMAGVFKIKSQPEYLHIIMPMSVN